MRTSLKNSKSKRKAISDMEKYIVLGIAVFIVFVFVCALCLCKASGEADRHSERMMNEDKEDKEQR